MSCITQEHLKKFLADVSQDSSCEASQEILAAMQMSLDIQSLPIPQTKINICNETCAVLLKNDVTLKAIGWDLLHILIPFAGLDDNNLAFKVLSRAALLCNPREIFTVTMEGFALYQELEKRLVLLRLLALDMPRLINKSSSYLESFLSVSRRCVSDAFSRDSFAAVEDETNNADRSAMPQSRSSASSLRNLGDGRFTAAVSATSPAPVLPLASLRPLPPRGARALTTGGFMLVAKFARVAAREGGCLLRNARGFQNFF